MTTYLISRHSGAVEWIGKRGYADAVRLEHLDDATRVHTGDVVIGTLPIGKAAAICARGAEFINLSLDLPEGERGRELTAVEMDRYGARLEPMEIRTASTFRLRNLCRQAFQIAGRLWEGARYVIRQPGQAYERLEARCTRWLGFIWVCCALASGGALGNRFEAFLSAFATATASNPPSASLRETLIGALTFVWPTDLLPRVLGLLLVVGLFMSSTVLAYRLRNALFALTVRHRHGQAASQRPMVLMCLSDPRNLHVGVDQAQIDAWIDGAGSMTLEVACEEGFTNGKGGRLNWQQNLRVVRHHLGREGDLLKRIVLIPTRQSEPFAEQFFIMLRGLIRNSFGARGAKIAVGIDMSVSPAVDEYDYEGYRRTFRNEITAAGHRQNAELAAHEISIDATAGRKLASIAAAEITFNGPIEFTYVDELGVIHAFDARVAAAPES